MRIVQQGSVRLPEHLKQRVLTQIRQLITIQWCPCGSCDAPHTSNEFIDKRFGGNCCDRPIERTRSQRVPSLTVVSPLPSPILPQLCTSKADGRHKHSHSFLQGSLVLCMHLNNVGYLLGLSCLAMLSELLRSTQEEQRKRRPDNWDPSSAFSLRRVPRWLILFAGLSSLRGEHREQQYLGRMEPVHTKTLQQQQPIAGPTVASLNI
jgi:hypothetical protein